MHYNIVVKFNNGFFQFFQGTEELFPFDKFQETRFTDYGYFEACLVQLRSSKEYITGYFTFTLTSIMNNCPIYFCETQERIPYEE